MLLRYPGGKAKIYKKVQEIIATNDLSASVYCEPYAGGFGLGLKLLLKEDVKKFIINDFDKHIYALWYSVFYQPEKLIEKIQSIDITIQEWHRQKQIYNNYMKFDYRKKDDKVVVGFATLFLNRTNFSGILTGGPIGGIEQRGKYKLDCRFNKSKIISIIKELAKYQDRVSIFNYDAIKLIEKLKSKEEKIFYNFDPPYVKKGKELYLNAYEEQDHTALENRIESINAKWIMTYDNEKLIRDLYKDFAQRELHLNYTVFSKRQAKEILISNFAFV